MKVNIGLLDVVLFASLFIGIVMLAWQRTGDMGSMIAGFGSGMALVMIADAAKSRKNPWTNKQKVAVS